MSGTMVYCDRRDVKWEERSASKEYKRTLTWFVAGDAVVTTSTSTGFGL